MGDISVNEYRDTMPFDEIPVSEFYSENSDMPCMLRNFACRHEKAVNSEKLTVFTIMNRSRMYAAIIPQVKISCNRREILRK